MSKYSVLEIGDPAPWFTQASSNNANFHFDTAGGRYLVLGFFGSGADEGGKNMLNQVRQSRELFDDNRIAFFGVSVDPDDARQQRVVESIPGIRFFWDFNGAISRLYGALPMDEYNQPTVFRRFWVVLNPNFRIRAIIPASARGEPPGIIEYLLTLPSVDYYSGVVLQAPIILLPNVFDADFCHYLIKLYESHGGIDSGFMREEYGKTVGVVDYDHKRRSDYTIEDQQIITQLQRRIVRKINPELQKVHQFTATRMERYIIACYESATGGHFRAHRDDTTKGTAHREFAVSVNLNDDYDGGGINFPEYGSRTFKAPVGGAVIFSCSLLHRVTPVTQGRRFVFLPFLYNEESAMLREANNAYLSDDVGHYRK